MKLEAKVTKNIKVKLITIALQQALDAYAEKLDPILDAQFTDPKWGWTDRQTRRRNGQVVGSPRDIVDTGELLASKQGPKTGKPPASSTRDVAGNAINTDGTSDMRRYWVWDSPYASAVKNGTSSTMPRDWIKAALAELPFKEYVLWELSRRPKQ